MKTPKTRQGFISILIQAQVQRPLNRNRLPTETSGNGHADGKPKEPVTVLALSQNPEGVLA